MHGAQANRCRVEAGGRDEDDVVESRPVSRRGACPVTTPSAQSLATVQGRRHRSAHASGGVLGDSRRRRDRRSRRCAAPRHRWEAWMPKPSMVEVSSPVHGSKGTLTDATLPHAEPVKLWKTGCARVRLATSCRSLPSKVPDWGHLGYDGSDVTAARTRDRGAVPQGALPADCPARGRGRRRLLPVDVAPRLAAGARVVPRGERPRHRGRPAGAAAPPRAGTRARASRRRGGAGTGPRAGTRARTGTRGGPADVAARAAAAGVERRARRVGLPEPAVPGDDAVRGGRARAGVPPPQRVGGGLRGLRPGHRDRRRAGLGRRAVPRGPARRAGRGGPPAPVRLVQRYPARRPSPASTTRPTATTRSRSRSPRSRSMPSAISSTP